MADIDEVRSQVRSHLIYDYPGNSDDEDGSGDRIWINKNQKYEVDYAIAKCLIDCKATVLATNTEVVRKLEEMIQDMDHDGMGHCIRTQAHDELQKKIYAIWLAIIKKKLNG